MPRAYKSAKKKPAKKKAPTRAQLYEIAFAHLIKAAAANPRDAKTRAVILALMQRIVPELPIPEVER